MAANEALVSSQNLLALPECSLIQPRIMEGRREGGREGGREGRREGTDLVAAGCGLVVTLQKE